MKILTEQTTNLVRAISESAFTINGNVATLGNATYNSTTGFAQADYGGAVPSDFVIGRYFFTAGAFVKNENFVLDLEALARTWAAAKPMDPDVFPAFVAAVVGAPKWNTLTTNDKTSFIWDIVFAPTQRAIDPNDKRGSFKRVMDYLRGKSAFGVNPALVSPADDAIMFTHANEVALANTWNQYAN